MNVVGVIEAVTSILLDFPKLDDLISLLWTE
jgi:hypothetical protein